MVRLVLVREDLCRKRAVRCVCDQAIHTVSQVLIGANISLRQVDPLMPLIAHGVLLDIPTGWAEKVLVILDTRLHVLTCVSAPSIQTTVNGGDVGGTPLATCIVWSTFSM